MLSSPREPYALCSVHVLPSYWRIKLLSMKLGGGIKSKTIPDEPDIVWGKRNQRRKIHSPEDRSSFRHMKACRLPAFPVESEHRSCTCRAVMSHGENVVCRSPCNVLHVCLERVWSGNRVHGEGVRARVFGRRWGHNPVVFARKLEKKYRSNTNRDDSLC